MKNTSCLKNDYSIVVGGEAGHGINTVGYILTSILKLEGYNVFVTNEFMSRIRGGSNSCEIRISSKPVSSYVDKIDILVPLDISAINHLRKRIDPKTIIIGEKSQLKEENNIFDVALSKIAKEIGDVIYSNIIACGVIFGLFEVSEDTINDFLKNFFSSKDDKVIQKNLEANQKGREIGSQLHTQEKIKFNIQKNEKIKQDLLISGTEAIGLGVIAGGLKFISSYPMSPSTGVLTFLATHADEFEMIVEQAEDEISAINMALGASYAGARSMVSTSGGGFALMSEGLSLAGMIETPIVIHLSQRPGPATGLPTRTEQGDLELALYSGHGDFPRIILAPGNLQDAFLLSREAFYLAEKYQIPVILLTDQFFVDSYCNIESLDLFEKYNENFIVETKENYRRFELTSNGISPRGIPGFGKGLVAVDSDEHDEAGHITENLDLRITMVDKRRKKKELIEQEIIPPELIGNTDYKTLIIGWGSTYSAIIESIQCIGMPEISFLYFKQVYPISFDIKKYLEKAQNLIIIENNSNGQFSNLIKFTTGIEIKNKILKYNGLPFSVEELVEEIMNILERRTSHDR